MNGWSFSDFGNFRFKDLNFFVEKMVIGIFAKSLEKYCFDSPMVGGKFEITKSILRAWSSLNR